MALFFDREIEENVVFNGCVAAPLGKALLRMDRGDQTENPGVEVYYFPDLFTLIMSRRRLIAYHDKTARLQRGSATPRASDISVDKPASAGCAQMIGCIRLHHYGSPSAAERHMLVAETRTMAQSAPTPPEEADFP